ncbi:MAG: aminoacyl-histidine dipeptidase [Clostridia bacterium]|nr:aminoacyl-histidine dipeptidase [Clostridia bacterium]MBQ9798193.1 aminoacyl-histidine dipeptidase [Clostridia bacterium]
MNYLIHDRKPESVFRFFEELCAIPHPSYHEERVADYLEAFAAARGLECYRDKLHNVLIKKPATPDMKHSEALLFQGHTDMVCVKTTDSVHDFMSDALQLYLDGDFLRAKGTTLGADDGIAVAVMLAVLDGALTSHPALECLFTAAEEVGLDGAEGFDYSKISARKMINMDSEDLGIVTAGCAGGLRSTLTLKYAAVPFVGTCIKINLQGLFGGHSGVDICTGRANANKLMGRLLAKLAAATKVNLVSICGGSKDNAIPRDCEATVAVSDAAVAIACIKDEAARISAELVADDRDFAVTACETEAPDQMLSDVDSAHAVALLATVDNGVKEMNRNVKGLAEWSRNLGVVKTEDGKMEFVFAARSAMESRLDASIDELNALAALTGCTAAHYNRYPGWDYAPVSPLRDLYLRAYREVTGQDATVNVIHAGLECGIIFSKVPDMDVISIGPDMRDVHSPDERLNLSTVETLWKTIEKTVELLK